MDPATAFRFRFFFQRYVRWLKPVLMAIGDTSCVSFLPPPLLFLFSDPIPIPLLSSSSSSNQIHQHPPPPLFPLRHRRRKRTEKKKDVDRKSFRRIRPSHFGPRKSLVLKLSNPGPSKKALFRPSQTSKCT